MIDASRRGGVGGCRAYGVGTSGATSSSMSSLAAFGRRGYNGTRRQQGQRLAVAGTIYPTPPSASTLQRTVAARTRQRRGRLDVDGRHGRDHGVRWRWGTCYTASNYTHTSRARLSLGPDMPTLGQSRAWWNSTP